MSGSPEDRCARIEEASRYVLGELHGRRLDSYARHLLRCGACAEEVDLLEHAAGSVELLVNARAVAPPALGGDSRTANPTRLKVAAESETASTRGAGRGGYADRAPGDREAAGREPGDRDREPGDRDREPGDRDREPGDRDLEPASRNREPADRQPSGRAPAVPLLRPISGGGAASARAARTSLADGYAARARRRPAVRARTVGGTARTRFRSPIPRAGLVGFFALAVLAVGTVALSGSTASVRYGRIQAGWQHGGAAVKLQGSHLELLVEGMPRPARGHGYEVWVVNAKSGGPAATGAWVKLNRLGEAGVDVPGDYHRWDAIAVYVEPLHGPDTTRSGAVVVGDLRGINSRA